LYKFLIFWKNSLNFQEIVKSPWRGFKKREREREMTLRHGWVTEKRARIRRIKRKEK
jgi:hypothetical protein